MKQGMELKITNTKNGLHRWVDIEKYSFEDLENIFTDSVDAGYEVKIVRNLTPPIEDRKINKIIQGVKENVYEKLIWLGTAGVYGYIIYRIVKGNI